MAGPKVIIIGGGVGAIAMAHTLKWKLGFTNFEVRSIHATARYRVAANDACKDLRQARTAWRYLGCEYLPWLVSEWTQCWDETVLQILTRWLRSGSDVPIHLYSFSFNLNPDWTQALADQEEILDCKNTEYLLPAVLPPDAYL